MNNLKVALRLLGPFLKIQQRSKKHLFLMNPARILKSTQTRLLSIASDETALRVDKDEIDLKKLGKKTKFECFGCGSMLQSKSNTIQGFVPLEKMLLLNKSELFYTLCERCETVNKTGKLLDVETTQIDYDKFIIDNLCSLKKANVIILVDLLDMPNSIYEGWSRLLIENKNIEVCIIGNKFDLLPKTGPIFKELVLECLKANCAKMGIKGPQIKLFEVISAKTGYNIEKVINSFFRLWNETKTDVYLLGATNAGKSVLFNQLLSSDYCKPLASNAILRATTSFWPSTTLNMLKFPITQLDKWKYGRRVSRLVQDRKTLEIVDQQRNIFYEKTKDLRHAECIGIVGNSFKPDKINDDQVETSVEATYSLNSASAKIEECKSFERSEDIESEQIELARLQYNPKAFKNKAAWFYDTPGLLKKSHEIMKNFSKQELQLINPLGIVMPRVYYLKPGQTIMISGLMRIDLLESTNDELVLFSIMASQALPIVNPFKTSEAEEKYKKYYEEGSTLRVPYSKHIRQTKLPDLESRIFEIECIGNHKSTSDIVFSSYGWAAVTSRPNVKAKVRAFTLGAEGLVLREPSLLPFVVNMRLRYQRKDNSQSFKTIYYKKPSTC